MLVLVCERIGEYKALKKKSKQNLRTKKYGFLFMLHGYVKKEMNDAS